MKKENFIPTNNDLSYYPLLFKALEETKGVVLELGTGHGSTQLLHDTGRILFSYEEKETWLNKFKHLENNNHKISYVINWRQVKINHPDPAVIFIDHAPGEDRKLMIQDYKASTGILVIHDTEPAADHGYQMRQYFPFFKYIAEVKTNGAWATALSNNYDLNKWKGEIFGNYIIS